MQQKQYKIGYVKYVQTELTYGQAKRLGRLYLLLMSKSGDDDEITFGKIKSYLERYDLVGYFFGVILKRKSWIWDLGFGIWNLLHLRAWPFVNANSAPASLVGEIFTDFFFLNSSLLSNLSNLESGLGLIAQAGMKMTDTNPAEMNPAASTRKKTGKKTAVSKET